MTSMINQIRKRMKTNNDKKDNLRSHQYAFCSCHSGSNCNFVYGSFTEPGKPPNIFGFTMLRITTGSMEPTYATDTLLVVKKTDPKEIMEGDVISFYSTDPALEGAVNTHRVVSISQDGDSYIYTTKGDANNAADLYDAQSRYLIGKVIWSSLFLGKLSRLAANPLIFIPLILIPLAAILITNLVHTVRLAKTIAKEEEEAAVKEAIQALRAEREQKK